MSLQMPVGEAVYRNEGELVRFNQLAVKIDMSAVLNQDYFAWLDRARREVGRHVRGARIVEKEKARESPPLNTAVYYDTPSYSILPTGSLLRTSCNRITHAFCAFKLAEDAHGVRRDHRYVFAGEEKEAIQEAPTSETAVGIVCRLLARTDMEHPGTHLRRHCGIDPRDLRPAICLDDLRYTFFAWLDGRDALRCSVDRASVYDLRRAGGERRRESFGEVELAIYPRIDPEVSRDPRVVELIEWLSADLRREFGVEVTPRIKYQRAAEALGLPGGA